MKQRHKRNKNKVQRSKKKIKETRNWDLKTCLLNAFT